MEREFENNSNSCKTYTLTISIKSNKSMEPELLINGGRKLNRMLSFDSLVKVIAVISSLSGAEMVMKRRKNVGRKPREHRRLPFP